MCSRDREKEPGVEQKPYIAYIGYYTNIGVTNNTLFIHIIINDYYILYTYGTYDHNSTACILITIHLIIINSIR